MIHLHCNPQRPPADLVRRAADAIRAGQVVAIPTDTLYGLAVDPLQPRAIERLYAVKGRQRDQGVPLVAADVTQVEDLLGPLSELARVLTARFWPGPLTLLLAAPERLAADVGAGGTVGVRVPALEVTRELCRAVGRPVTATSANLSGQLATDDPGVVEAAIGDRIDVLLDAGHTAGGPPSTIVDVTGGRVRLVRAGAIAWDTIDACLRA